MLSNDVRAVVSGGERSGQVVVFVGFFDIGLVVVVCSVASTTISLNHALEILGATLVRWLLTRLLS